MSRSSLHVAIVGATGAVGQEFLAVLEQRQFPIGKLTLLASPRSAGTQIAFKGEALTVQALSATSFAGVDLALFSAGGGISKEFAPIAVRSGAVVVDNSSAFRMADDVPLIVPEVNPDAMSSVSYDHPGIIANPNCSTIIMLMAATPLHRAAAVKRAVVSTYQAASGAGAAAMRELQTQTQEVLQGKSAEQLTQDVFHRQYAFNLFSHDSPMQRNGYNYEELKMVNETAKIWQSPVPITATCIRVPVMRAHAESINLTLGRPMDETEARSLLSQAPGVSVLDDRANNRFPEPLDATGKDDVFVGRIRQDISQPGKVGIDLFVCGDQIRKGAALNAVQIAELLR